MDHSSSRNARVLSFEKSPVIVRARTPGSGGNLTPSRPVDAPPALVGKQSFRRASASKASWQTQLRMLQEQVKHADSKLQQSQEQLFEERCKAERLKRAEDLEENFMQQAQITGSRGFSLKSRDSFQEKTGSRGSELKPRDSFQEEIHNSGSRGSGLKSRDSFQEETGSRGFGLSPRNSFQEEIFTTGSRDSELRPRNSFQLQKIQKYSVRKEDYSAMLKELAKIKKDGSNFDFWKKQFEAVAYMANWDKKMFNVNGPGWDGTRSRGE